MTKRPSKEDPFAEREAQNYERPIPSREFILDVLAKADGPLNRNQLSRELVLEDADQVDALSRRLRAMERDGQLICNRKGAYGLVDKMDLLRGRVQAHRDGYGFLILQEGGDDLYLSARQMKQVFDGDEVLCRVAGYDRRGRQEATIVEVLKRGVQQLVGRLFYESGVAFVVPDSARITQDILIPEGESGGAHSGQYVMIRITTQPGPRARPTGSVIEVLGEHMAPGMEIDVAIRSHDIPHVWPEAVEDEANALPTEPDEASKTARVDLRKQPFVTIDGEDAKDFDDAVYCEKKRFGGWRLWVAIADVSHYVQVGSALDQEAERRGTSVYFPGRVVPMLPEALSNGLCSLKPAVDRLCMVCEMTISRDGKLKDYQFFEGIIHSAARLTYNKVAAMLDSEADDHKALRDQYKTVLPHVEQLHQLYKALRKARDVRGAIDFETVETRIVFGPERKIDKIVPVQRNDAHKLIEECMLSANVATALFLEKHKLPSLFRVHVGPTEKKLETLREYLGELGLNLGGGGTPGPDEYQTLLAAVAERPDANIIQTMLLRSMSQAVYQPENKGHFGLNYDAYAHFTSPIRRYPDLLVHRAIRSVIRSSVRSGQVQRVAAAAPLKKERIYPYDMPAMLRLGEQCSMSERRADDATRDVESWLKCEYLLDRVGEQFLGVVSAVTGFGLFVELKDIYVEGLIHVSSLASDYYNFDPARQRLIGDRTRVTYQLGDELVVQVARVSLEDKKIDLELVAKQGDAKKFPSTKSTSAKKSPAKKPQRKAAVAGPSPVSAEGKRFAEQYERDKAKRGGKSGAASSKSNAKNSSSKKATSAPAVKKPAATTSAPSTKSSAAGPRKRPRRK